MRPPRVGQGTRPICWAAALSSFSRVTRNLAPRKRDEFVAMFKPFLNPDDSLKTSSIRVVSTRLKLRADLQHGGGTLSTSYLGPKLRRSHVLVIYRPPGSDFTHTVVVYGVDRFNICYMDPIETRRKTGQAHGGERLCRKIWEFGDGATDFLVMWRD